VRAYQTEGDNDPGNEFHEVVKKRMPPAHYTPGTKID